MPGLAGVGSLGNLMLIVWVDGAAGEGSTSGEESEGSAGGEG